MTDDRLMSAKKKFSRLLKEIFQFDCADLDFGIYRILAMRRTELEDFLDNDLLPQVEEILSSAAGDRSAVERELQELEEQLRGMGVSDYTAVPKWNEVKGKLALSPDVAALAREVFSDLTTFFGRYYDEGDFMALPRYKGDTYAIPYDGSEVKLHWANADQYYIKTTEQHADYTAVIDGVQGLDNPRLCFQLAAAESDRDNNKSSEKRRYVLRAEAPVEVEGNQLTIWFEYRVPEPGNGRQPTQKSICDQIEQSILKAVPQLWQAALKKKSKQSPEKYNVLGYQLYRYTKKNTSDYFIHKDLGGFLRRELDYFIKNEVLFLDDIEDRASADIEVALQKLKAIRSVGGKIIDWLAQLEELQKRLYLKQKFVLRTDWLVSLSLLSKGLCDAINNNPAQREQWSEIYPGRLSGDDGFVVDTQTLSDDLRMRVRAEIGGITRATFGEVIRGENLHALRLVSPQLAGQVQVSYIDPPYNTGGDGFMYRDAYQHSSWLALLRDRLMLNRKLASPNGTITMSIDDAEMHRAKELLDEVWGPELAKLVWDRNRKNDARFFSVGHEYMLVHAVNYSHLRDSGATFREPKEGLLEAQTLFRRLRQDHTDDWETIREKWLRWFDNIPVSDPRRRLRRYSKVGPRGPYRDDGNINWPGGGGPRYEVLHPETKKPCRLPRSGWRFPTPERFWEEVQTGRVVFGEDETTVPAMASYLFESEGQVMPSVFYSYAQTAAQEFDAMFGQRVFDNPKNWRDLCRIIRYLGEDDSLILDYFAGSGSTGHAVMSLNRLDGGRRRFILVEMGEHGDTVLLPRLQKAAFTDDWDNGAPQATDPVPLLVKVSRIESYDDTLENLVMQSDPNLDPLFAGNANLREDYILRYMLDIESTGSLLNLERFRKPWNYTIKVRRDGVLQDSPVDLVETFNYLIGLRVKRYDTYGQEGLLFVIGTDPDGRRAIIVWRDADLWPNDRLEEKCRQAFESFRPDEFDLVYVNGDNHLPIIKKGEESWKVNLIEETFHARMFDTSDVE